MPDTIETAEGAIGADTAELVEAEETTADTDAEGVTDDEDDCEDEDEMATIVTTVVEAAPGCCGQYERVRRVHGRFEASTVSLFTHGQPRRAPWERISDEEAARLLDKADGHVPATWLAVGA